MRREQARHAAATAATAADYRALPPTPPPTISPGGHFYFAALTVRIKVIEPCPLSRPSRSVPSCPDVSPLFLLVCVGGSGRRSLCRLAALHRRV